MIQINASIFYSISYIITLFLWHLVLTKWHKAVANSVGPGFATLGTSR